MQVNIYSIGRTVIRSVIFCHKLGNFENYESLLDVFLLYQNKLVSRTIDHASLPSVHHIVEPLNGELCECVM